MIQRTIKLHTGVEKTLNSTKIITKTEWQKAAEKLYGSDVKQWRFKCPICGHTASVQEIMSADGICTIYFNELDRRRQPDQLHIYPG